MEILLGLAIIGLVVSAVVDKVLSSRERISMAKINKAREVSEIFTLFPENEKEAAELGLGTENSDLVDLDQISVEDVIE